MNIFTKTGKMTISFFRSVGQLSIFTFKTVSHIVRPPFYFKALWQQMVEIGFYSLPVVALTTLFSGMVIALQSYSGLSTLSSEGVVASVVELTITRELGPVLAALMVAGRVGAAMAAEIGTMRVTEQIDALTSLSTNPFNYLIVPRVLAGMLMLPLLLLVGDVIGIYGGYLISVYKLDFNEANFLHNTWNFMQAIDIYSGMTKAAVFGFIVTLLGCYNGFNSKGGAEGVGAATTNAVVVSSILILVSNYWLTELFFAR